MKDNLSHFARFYVLVSLLSYLLDTLYGITRYNLLYYLGISGFL